MINNNTLDKLLLSQKIVKLTRAGFRSSRIHTEEKNISVVMGNILVVIYTHSDVSQDFVANMLDMDKSSVAKIISKAIDLNLVDRHVNPDDRREYRLSLTQKGSELVEELLENIADFFSDALDGIDSDSIKVCRSVITLIDRNISKME